MEEGLDDPNEIATLVSSITPNSYREYAAHASRPRVTY